jgi:hypothetical protein
MVAGGSGLNSGEELTGEGRERVEGGPGFTTGRFGVEVGTEGCPAVGLRGPAAGATAPARWMARR